MKGYYEKNSTEKQGATKICMYIGSWSILYGKFLNEFENELWIIVKSACSKERYVSILFWKFLNIICVNNQKNYKNI